MKTSRLIFALVALSFLAINDTSAGKMIVAHRFGAGEREENTLPALKECLKNNVFCYETDIHISSDGRLIVSHDASLKRVYGVDLSVETAAKKELEAVKSPKGAPVSYLREFIDLVRDRTDIFIQIEIKTPGNDPQGLRRKELVRKLCDELSELNFKDERVMVISFSKSALVELRALDPKIKTGWLLGGGSDKKPIEEALAAGFDALSVEIHGTTWSFVKDARKAGLKVAGWTIRSDSDLALAKALDFDMIVTDYPVKYAEK